MPIRVIPVLDVVSGIAVHAVAGERAHYQPLRSILHHPPDPVGLARAYRDMLGLYDVYLADLDAIAGHAPDVALYRELIALGLSLWVDAGVRDAASLVPLLQSGVTTVIVGLESLRGPWALAQIRERLDPERLVFSLDLRGGIPVVAKDAEWPAGGPEAIAELVMGLGVRRFLLLDLARVGTGRGPGTHELLRKLSRHRAAHELIAGGGVRGAADLGELEDAGAAAVLVGSALHDGRIDASELIHGHGRGHGYHVP